MYYVFKTSRNMQIYYKTNLDNLILPNDTKCSKKLTQKSWQKLQNLWLHMSSYEQVTVIYSVGLIYGRIYI